MAQREGSVGRLIGALHDEMRSSDVDLTNFASCLRVLALHYGISNADRLQERPPGVGGARLPGSRTAGSPSGLSAAIVRD